MERHMKMSTFWRLTPAISLTLAVALLVAGLQLAVYSEGTYRRQKADEVSVQARILASTVTAALAFDDRGAAQEYVDALQANPEIQAVAVYDQAGTLFASYRHDPALPLPPPVRRGEPDLDAERVAVAVPVMQGASVLGTVHVVTMIEPVARRIARYGVIALLVTMASLVVAVLGVAHAALRRANLELAARARDLAEANRNLHAEIEERAKAEGALRQSQKMEAIGQLSGGMAHDFNNLLAAVLGNLELMRKRLPPDDRCQRLLANAIQGAERGAALTQRLLAFARRQDLRPEPVGVPDLVRGMADLLQRSIGPIVRIETRFPIHLPPVLVDANQLELALINLAVNARDAMPEGGLVIIAADEAVAGAKNPEGLTPGPYVRLGVTDTGEGMDEATLARAMEPFFTTKGVGKGTGLGLSMVHGLAAQSGGRLILKSAPGEGTTAELWLPVAAAAPAAAPPDRAAERAGEAAAVRALTVLVVDDDALVRLGTAAMIEDLGYGVLEAASGAEALALLRGGRSVDLVLTDQAMPMMLGTQLAATVRAERPDLPIVLMTGYAELASIAVDLPKLRKPFRQDILAAALADAIAAEGAVAAP